MKTKDSELSPTLLSFFMGTYRVPSTQAITCLRDQVGRFETISGGYYSFQQNSN